jgi:hypothetical protein
MTISVENCTAYDIIENLGEEMDLMRAPQMKKWKAFFTQKAYDKVKSAGYVYEKDGYEYVKVWDNQAISFVIHMRIAGIDNSLREEMPYELGCRRALDR